MNNAQTNQQTNYVLKLLDKDYQAKNNFQYPQEVGAKISCPDWLPTQDCGNGLHGFLNGEGNLSSTDYRAKAMILDVKDYIDLDGKIKFEFATVVAFGEVFEITAKLRGLVGNNKVINLLNLSSTQTEFWIAGSESTLSAGDYSTLKSGHRSVLSAGDRSTLSAGNYSTLTAGYKSTLKSGHRSVLTAGDKSTLSAGNWSTLSAGDGSTLSAGNESTMTVRGDTCFVVKGGENCTLSMFWGSECVLVKLDSLLEKFEIGDTVKIVKGEVVID